MNNQTPNTDEHDISPNSLTNSEASEQLDNNLDIEFQSSTESTTSLVKKAVAQITIKAIPISSMYIISTAASLIKLYAFSKLGTKNLGASAIINSTTKLLASPMQVLNQQNASLIAKEYGKLKKATSMQVNSSNDFNAQSEIKLKIGNIWRQGIVLGTAASVPPMVGLFFMKPVLKSLGISDEISSLAQDYFIPYAFALPVETILNTGERFLSAVDKEKWLIPYKLIMDGVDIGLSLFLIPRYGNTGAGLAAVGQSLAGLTIASAFFMLDKEIIQYKLFNLCLAFDLTPMKRMLVQGLPITIAQFAITGTNFAVSILVGQLGTSRLAIEQVVMSYMGLSNALHGISEASNRLVGQALGRKNYRELRILGNTSLIMSSSLFLGMAAVYNIIPMQLSSLYLNHEILQESESTIRYVFGLACLGRVLMAIYDTAGFNLAGMQDTFLSSLVNLVATAAVILPLSIVNNYLLHFDIYGINIAIDIGLSIMAGTTVTHWFRQSNHAVNQNAFDTKKDTSNIKVQNLFQCKSRLFQPRTQQHNPLLSVSTSSEQDDNNSGVQITTASNLYQVN